MFRVGLDFIERAITARDLADLRRAAERLAGDLGIEYWACFEHGDHRFDQGSLAWLHNYPAAFTGPYRQEGWVNHDIVPALAKLSLDPFDWSDTVRMAKTSAERMVLQEAAGAGLAQGFTVPIRAARMPAASLTAASRSGIDPAVKPSLTLVAAPFYESLLRLWPTPRVRASGVRLPARERECLAWAAEGKSSSVIADIMGLSTDTVDEYFNRARMRYGVSTRVQAIARAIMDGEIAPQG